VFNLPHNAHPAQLPSVAVARGDDFPTGFRQLPASVDQLLTDLMSVGRGTAITRALTDAYLTDDPPTLNVTVDIAGLDPQTLEVILDGAVLTIRGGRRRPAESGRRVYQHVEIDWGPFERRVRIETPVDPASATVTYDRGLLQIALPLAQRPVVARVLIGVRIPG
jgi:HSP20 family protein